MFLQPSFLQTGDTVLIIATARARNLQAIQFAIDTLTKWGLKVELGANVFKVHNQFAGTDQERAFDLQWAIDHPKAKAVLFSGGGYGALRVIDHVDFSKAKNYPKWFIGYSDTTVVHSRLLKLHIAVIHGTMAFQFDRDIEATESIKNLLFGIEQTYGLAPHKLNRAGISKGVVVGGNLSLIYALSGSVDDLQTDGKILFLEDLDEQLYHIDRMMLQLKRSGKLKNLAGLVIGGMTEMKDNAVPFGQTAEEIILEAVKEYSYPVMFNFPTGHIQKNMALYLGIQATMNVGKTNVEFSYIEK